jgi:hypothetical protein
LGTSLYETRQLMLSILSTGAPGPRAGDHFHGKAFDESAFPVRQRRVQRSHLRCRQAGLNGAPSRGTPSWVGAEVVTLETATPGDGLVAKVPAQRPNVATGCGGGVVPTGF